MLAMAVGLIAAAWMAANNPPTTAQPMAWAFLSLLLIPIVLQLLGGDLRNPWRAFEMALYITSAWLIYRMAGAGASSMLGSRQWCLLLGLVGNISVLYAVLQQFHLPLFEGFEIFPIWQLSPTAFAGIQVQQNLQGLFLALICMPLWARALTESKSFPWWLASILPAAGLLATSGRGSALVLFIGAALIIWMSSKRLLALRNIALTLLIAAAISQYWHMFPNLTGQEATLTDRLASVGVQTRFFIWDMCLHLYLQHPWLGIGAGNLMSYGTEAIPPLLAIHPEYGAAASSMIGGHASAHNLLLQFFLEWGVVGGFALTAFIFLLGIRGWRLMSQNNVNLCDGRIQAGIGIALMLLHGMFSVSMMQGFFMAMLGLYTAAFLINTNALPTTSSRSNFSDQSSSSNRSKLLRFSIFLIPAIFMLYNWQLFINREWNAEKAAHYEINDARFIQNVSAAIDSPWSARAALQWYIGRLVFEHAPQKIVASENFVYRYWMLHQGTLSLRYLILVAHLKNDIYAERRWISLFRAAYPLHERSNSLKYHAEHGHAEGEIIDLGL
ncbi:MAG: O-antigen ligase family protein [Mariprofundaceae bacterium]